MTRPLIRPRTCSCCGETKKTADFSWNAKVHAYCPSCRECGQWLVLFIQAAGSAEDRDDRPKKLKPTPAFSLQDVWR